MPVTAGKKTAGSSKTDFQRVVDSIDRCRDELYRIDLHYRPVGSGRGRRFRVRDSGRYLDIIRKNGSLEETPEAIAELVFQLADTYNAERDGDDELAFVAAFMRETETGKVEEIKRVDFSIAEEWSVTDDDDAGGKSESTQSLLRVIDRYERCLEKALGREERLATVFEKLAERNEAFGTTIIELAKLQREEQQAQREHEADMEQSRTMQQAFLMFAEKLAPQVAAWVNGWMSGGFASQSPPDSSELRSWLTNLSTRESKQLQTVIGEHLWDLLQKLSTCSPEEQPDIVAALAAKMPTDMAAMQRLLERVAAVVGPERTQTLMQILTRYKS